jgi:hypothetical protein
MVIDLKANVEAKIRETKARQVIERELQVARQIQTSLLPLERPPFPDRPEFSLDADIEPGLVIAGARRVSWFPLQPPCSFSPGGGTSRHPRSSNGLTARDDGYP